MLYRHLGSKITVLFFYRDRKRRKKQHFDGQSDLSGSLKSLDGAKDWDKIRKSTSTDSVIVLKKQVRRVLHVQFLMLCILYNLVILLLFFWEMRS